MKFARGKEGRTRATRGLARARGRLSLRARPSAACRLRASSATINADSSGNVTVERVAVGSVNAAGARTGSINIAGVRLAISPGGRVEGTSGDINAGTVAFTRPRSRRAASRSRGASRTCRLARPRFTLEPGGRYRASADLSLGRRRARHDEPRARARGRRRDERTDSVERLRRGALQRARARLCRDCHERPRRFERARLVSRTWTRAASRRSSPATPSPSSAPRPAP